MKHKELKGFKLNQIVYIRKVNRWDRIVYIDDHALGNFCMANGGRFCFYDLED
jgi:hypothetical protein